jgi:hypothetical protein
MSRRQRYAAVQAAVAGEEDEEEGGDGGRREARHQWTPPGDIERSDDRVGGFQHVASEDAYSSGADDGSGVAQPVDDDVGACDEASPSPAVTRCVLSRFFKRGDFRMLSELVLSRASIVCAARLRRRERRRCRADWTSSCDS